MTLSESLALGGFVMMNQMLAEELGLDEAIMIGVYGSCVMRYGNPFFRQMHSLVEDSSMTDHRIRNATKKLVKNGLISIERYGIPPRNRYTLQKENLENLIKLLYGKKANTKDGESATQNYNPYSPINAIEEYDNSMIVGERDKRAKPKNAYGTFGNVLLTDEELSKFKEKFHDWADRIDSASISIEAKGYKYKNHYAMLLNWARREPAKKGGTIDY